MHIYDNQKTQAAKSFLEAIGFQIERSSNSRHDQFWEVKDKDGAQFASTLHDNELRQLAADVLTFSHTMITGRDVLKARKF